MGRLLLTRTYWPVPISHWHADEVPVEISLPSTSSHNKGKNEPTRASPKHVPHFRRIRMRIIARFDRYLDSADDHYSSLPQDHRTRFAFEDRSEPNQLGSWGCFSSIEPFQKHNYWTISETQYLLWSLDAAAPFSQDLNLNLKIDKSKQTRIWI
jgi:hypothetical protein